MSIKYRPDIDGLRAFAVIAVLGFHAFPSVLPGGFVGVDIFFVISGFLISSILLTDQRCLKLKIIDFYRRRVVRIFPALILVLFFCFFVGWYTLLGDEFKQLGKHILAGSFFSSNFILWSEAGYFDNASDLKPLLHLWSLGIEEQFYIFWPLLLFVLLKFERRLISILVLFIVVSFVFSLRLTYVDRIQAFYSPLSRFWELLAGAALAYACHNNLLNLSSLRSPMYPWVCFFAVIGFTFFYKESFYFPGWCVVVPVFSTVLILTPNENKWFYYRVLSFKPFVALGRVSYPLYLWHWPLLSFSSILNFYGNSSIVRAGLLVLSLIFAILTHIFFERPFAKVAKKIQLPVLIFFMGILAILGWDVLARDGLADIRYKSIVAIPPVVARDFIDWGDTGLIPKVSCDNPFEFPGSTICLVANPNAAPTVAVIGDSHAFHAYWGLKNVFDRYGENIILQGRGACLPLKEYIRGDDSDHCQPHMNKALTWIEKQSSIKKVLLIFRGRYLPSYASNSEKEALSGAINHTVSSLQASGKKVYIFYPVAEPGFDPRLCVGALPMGRTAPGSCDISLVQDLEKRHDLMRLLNQVALKFPQVIFVDPSSYLCSEGSCPVVVNGKSVFKDENHLSYSGSLLLGERLYDSGILK